LRKKRHPTLSGSGFGGDFLCSSGTGDHVREFRSRSKSVDSGVAPHKAAAATVRFLSGIADSHHHNATHDNNNAQENGVGDEPVPRCRRASAAASTASVSGMLRVRGIPPYTSRVDIGLSSPEFNGAPRFQIHTNLGPTESSATPTSTEPPANFKLMSANVLNDMIYLYSETANPCYPASSASGQPLLSTPPLSPASSQFHAQTPIDHDDQPPMSAPPGLFFDWPAGYISSGVNDNDVDVDAVEEEVKLCANDDMSECVLEEGLSSIVEDDEPEQTHFHSSKDLELEWHRHAPTPPSTPTPTSPTAYKISG
ncbi:hypothetical protein HK102_012901, partial [Quaeritorhiza haematococci]